MQRNSVQYTFMFAGAVCLVCSLFVSIAAVSLQNAQAANRLLDKQKRVLNVAGLYDPADRLSPAEIQQAWDDNIVNVIVDMRAGEEADEGAVDDPETYDPRRAAQDPSRSEAAPDNPARVLRVPHYSLVYQVFDESGDLSMVIVPIEGMGLWGMMYGYVAIDADFNTIRGITYYEHKETPGLGGEVDNPNWQNLWPGRKAYGEDGDVAVRVIKGSAGPPDEDPHRVDGMTGATFSNNGVTNGLQFWLGEHGFGPYLEQLRQEKDQPLEETFS
jgi:Na+-transporting NADH:ubiquinone oxidoreductase subunit C